MDLLPIISFICGIIVGWIWHARMLFSKILSDPDKMITLLEKYKSSKPEEDQIKADTRPIRVERHGNNIYLYAKDTEEFLAQGTSLQEALDVVEKRFPGQNFKGHLSKEEADNLGISIK